MRAVIMVSILLVVTGCIAETVAGRYERREDKDGNVTMNVDGPSTRGQKGSVDSGRVTISPDGTVVFGGQTVKQFVASMHGSPILIYAGIGVIVATAVLAWITGRWVLLALGAVVGAGLVGLGYYPWIGGVVAAVGALGGLMYVVYVFLIESKERKALRQITRGVDRAKDRLGPSKPILTNALRKEQDKETERVVTDCLSVSS